jgi:5-methyltetrahydrofolate--homocysteine methyltransferase
MNPNSRILSLLRQKVLILDGAMGTELQRRGLPTGVCPEAWCLAHPEAVAEIHAAYREAGADVVYTSTFGANRLKMGRYGLTNVRETNRSLAEIAVKAAGGGLVAGDIGPRAILSSLSATSPLKIPSRFSGSRRRVYWRGASICLSSKP